MRYKKFIKLHYSEMCHYSNCTTVSIKVVSSIMHYVRVFIGLVDPNIFNLRYTRAPVTRVAFICNCSTSFG